MPSLNSSAFSAFSPTRGLAIPYFASTVAAGFPSPADDYVDGKLDLNDLLIEHPAATFFVRVDGHSMRDSGIHPGDLLVVDRALEPADGAVVVAVLNGEFTVKRICRQGQKVYLVPENRDYLKLEITEAMDFSVWGVVTYVIHSV